MLLAIINLYFYVLQSFFCYFLDSDAVCHRILVYIAVNNVVLYLCICAAPLAVHADQRCFHCESPTEKRTELTERKEALG